MPLARLATVALGPVLLAQGRRVRRVTPRLPEASGDRTGLAHLGEAGSAGHPGSRASLRLLIAGDSSAAGVGVPEQRDALAGRLPRILAARLARPVYWQLEARTGATIEGLVDLLRAIEPQSFDAAAVCIGVNEVTARTVPAVFDARLDTLRMLLATRFGLPLIAFAQLPPMHRFPALPQPLRWWLGAHARRLDAALAAWAGARTDTVHVSIDLPPGTPDPAVGWIAPDGFHPGPHGYDAMARAFADVLAARLPVATSAAHTSAHILMRL